MENIFTVGQQVRIAYNQAADIKGYNRTGTITKVGRFGDYQVTDNKGETYSVDASDIAPMEVVAVEEVAQEQPVEKIEKKYVPVEQLKRQLAEAAEYWKEVDSKKDKSKFERVPEDFYH